MNSLCPACDQKRLHTAEELTLFHPLAGHGIQDGVPCCPDHPKEESK